MTTTTIAIDSTKAGQVVASGGTLVELRYLSAPDKGIIGPAGIFELTDSGGAVPGRPIWSCDLSTAMFPPSQTPSIFANQLIAGASIAFVDLMVARCPSGCKMEVDIE
jgi:hypothetical protein